jgi:DNA polymerase-1
MSWPFGNPFGDYDDVIAWDFEYQIDGGRHQDPENGRDKGGVQLPLSLAVRSARTGEARVYWRDQLLQMRRAPFDTGPRTLSLNWFASAESHCFAALEWKDRPQRLIDVFAEERWLRNGYANNKHPSLVDALLRHKLPCIGAASKEANRELIMTTSDWSPDSVRQTLRYNLSDADGTLAVGYKMAPKLDMAWALFRGRYDAACGVMEHQGVPLDAAWWERFSRVRKPLLLKLVKALDRFGIYDGLVFKNKRFAKLIAALKIPWERTEGDKQLLLKDEYFRDQVEVYTPILRAKYRNPDVQLVLQRLHFLRTTLSKLKEPKLAIGPDGRNRVILGPHGTVTDRNAYSTNQSIFGPDRWCRYTIVQPEGSALAYVDWSAQEIGITAFLSQDPRLIETYLSPDPYLYFAKMAGLLPEDVVRGPDDVERLRDKVKILFLGTNYGMTLFGLILRLGGDRELGRKMWKVHHEAYSVFWSWLQRALDLADARDKVTSMMGWQMHMVDDVHRPDRSTRPNTVKNWASQTHGAHMMQIGSIALIEAGVKVIFPLHDAFLVEGPKHDIGDIAEFTRVTMERAGEQMFGVPFRAKVQTFPERRFEDDRPGSKEMWLYVNRLLCEVEDELGITRRAA